RAGRIPLLLRPLLRGGGGRLVFFCAGVAGGVEAATVVDPHTGLIFLLFVHGLETLQSKLNRELNLSNAQGAETTRKLGFKPPLPPKAESRRGPPRRPCH